MKERCLEILKRLKFNLNSLTIAIYLKDDDVIKWIIEDIERCILYLRNHCLNILDKELESILEKIRKLIQLIEKTDITKEIEKLIIKIDPIIENSIKNK